MRRPIKCSRCGVFGHHLGQCKTDLKAPLETPSHNGIYRGKVPVREVPIGLSGSDLKYLGIMAQKRSVGLLRSRLSKHETKRDESGRFRHG